ncbi:MAG TPA: aldo/keto reductase, partial [Gaiellaceae bacterium]|nr:aldo/keto reductase [Gaiellaceae bacterium]
MERAYSRLMLGCGNFGGVGSAPAFFGQGASRDEAFALMDAAWEAGITWFDTADAYGGGRSETWIGEWRTRTGHSPTVTTKTFAPMDEAADHGLSPERVRRQAESSLRRLGVDRIDFYLAHAWDDDVPIAETFAAFEELRQAGKIGEYGVSNVDGAQFRAALDAGDPRWVENSYSLLDREPERELLPLCAERGVGFTAFGPLAGGWLTGKYRRGEPFPPGSRMTQRPGPYQGLASARTYDALARLQAM